jgi:hypothetical protein
LRMSLAVFRVWEFFRNKLAQRLETEYRNYLVIADEFAWACYQPVITAGILKEPPLTYFNGASSPFILTRKSRFEPEAVPRELIQGDAFEEALERLPFPVIGVPWNQSAHLAEAVVIGHEIGHSIEVDLKLRTTIRQLIKDALSGANGSNVAEWTSWASELFADAWGSLSTGPAFVEALLDFLGADSAYKATAPIPGDYAPAWLRFHFNLAVLANIGFKDEAAQLRNESQSAFPQPAEYALFAKQAEAVAEKLVLDKMAELKSRSMKETYCFVAHQQKAAKEQAANAVGNQPMRQIEDIRVWFAAAEYAFHSDPDGFERKQTGRKTAREIIEARIAECITPGRRRNERALTKEEKAVRAERDRSTASALFAAWRQSTQT